MEKKKGLLDKLFGKKEKQPSCCCDIQLEEIKDEEPKGEQQGKSAKDNDCSCCS